MPSSVSKVQRNYEIAKQLGRWKLLLLLDQHCFNQSFGLCWMRVLSSYRYRSRRNWDLGGVGQGSGRFSKPFLLLTFAAWSFSAVAAWLAQWIGFWMDNMLATWSV